MYLLDYSDVIIESARLLNFPFLKCAGKHSFPQYLFMHSKNLKKKKEKFTIKPLKPESDDDSAGD